MSLVTILAFAFLFWRAEEASPWLLVPHDDVFWTSMIVLIHPLLVALGAALAARRAQRLLVSQADTPQAAQHFYHRASLALRAFVVVGFAVTVLLTRWPDWFAFGRFLPALQIVGDCIVLTPFFLGLTVVWIAAYPAERMLRAQSLGRSASPHETAFSAWSFRSYLGFQMRHHVLVVAVPMALILFAANMARGYEAQLQAWTGSIWGPDVVVGAAVVAVFVVSPVMLRRIWRTKPLEGGPIRERLETIGRKIGLRFRDILVWNSDGMMVNAAVMGVFPPVRYVLLSDALLETMSAGQIVAVFGHEAGHVRHRHIQHFLVFAFVGWLIAVGVMELLAQTLAPPSAEGGLSALVIQGIGVAATVLFWGIGFGWLSRRFERQADLFGVSCVAPSRMNDCRLPCSVHLHDKTTVDIPQEQSPSGPASRSATRQEFTSDRVCATGAAVFASALERVAALNGIPPEERSWRHSSISSRIRFLMSLAGDPERAARFGRALRRVKTCLLILALAGSIATAVYCYVVPQPAILQFHTGGPQAGTV